MIFIKRLSIYLGIILSLFAAYLLLFDYGKNAQIRIDTGDIRYCFLKIPYRYVYMPDQERKAILSIIQNDPEIVGQWYICATFPLPSSNNTHLMCRHFYRAASAWVKVSPKIGRLVINDIILYIKKTGCKEGLPECSFLISSELISTKEGKYILNPDWRTHEFVQQYLQEKGVSMDIDNLR